MADPVGTQREAVLVVQGRCPHEGIHYDPFKREHVFVAVLDGQDCENVAFMLGSDGWARELSAVADRIAILDGPEEDATS